MLNLLNKLILITKNYRGNNNKSQVSPLLLLSVLTLLLSFQVIMLPNAFAGTKCDKIDNPDDRLECLKDKEDELSGELSEARNSQEKLHSKIEDYLSNLYVTQDQLNEVQAEINFVRGELHTINENLILREKSLQKTLELRNSVVRAYYQVGRHSSLEFFLAQYQSQNKDIKELNGFSMATLVYMFDKSLANEALDIIAKLNSEIISFEADKDEAESLRADLEADAQSLVALKADLDAKKALAEAENKELESEIAGLQDRIADLSSKQQEILAQKSGSGIVSGYEASSYKLPDPPFKPAFAAMSYGAYTHYKGMSQYGAKGRANDGKDYKDIIEFYFKEEVKKKDDFPSKIRVQGYGEMDFQKYLYGLAEMPSSWPEAALKAQAVAARSYAYNVMQGYPYDRDGGICTTQSCQVFLKSKSDNPPSSWKKAVDDTKRKIIGGSRSASGYGWYSSTAGGYISGVGWDKDGGSWPSNAYEKKAGSPWFYKAWYTKSYADNSGTCGRSTPWLKEKEMADILNSWRVWNKGSSSEKDHISPVDTSCWGGDPYSYDKMREKANKYGDSYTDINSIKVEISNDGYTSKIRFETNQGTVSIDGSEFKSIFNLRAPGYVSIRSRLFDIEMED